MSRLFLGSFLVLALGCGSSSLVQCRLDAVSRLPLAVTENPDALTLGDVKALVHDLKACRVPTDGGSP